MCPCSSAGCTCNVRSVLVRMRTQNHVKKNMSSDAKSGAFKDKDKPHDVRVSNITAAKGKDMCVQSVMLSLAAVLNVWKCLLLCITCIYLHAAVADAVRTSLGPRGMDKMVKIVILCLPYLLLWLYVTLVARFYGERGVAIH